MNGRRVAACGAALAAVLGTSCGDSSETVSTGGGPGPAQAPEGNEADEPLLPTDDPAADPMPDEPEADGEPDDDECMFLACDEDDAPATSGPECSLWEQDCPAGEKCNPHDDPAVGPRGAWDSAICVPVDADAGSVGDPCSRDIQTFANDSCELGTLCLNADQEGQQGTCAALCSGSPESPTCDSVDTACLIANDGFLPVCLQTCDPLAQDCAEGQGCYLGEGAFTCFRDVSGALGQAGDPCEFDNACAAGLLCVQARAIPGCPAEGCCTPFCEVDGPASQCTGEGIVCDSILAEGAEAPWAEGVGVCVDPT